MHHMSRRYHVSSYVRSCFKTVYQKKTTDSGKAVGGSLKQSSSSAHRVQQNLPSASVERGILSQPHIINPHPCTTTQTSSSVNTGVKRKVYDEYDGNETSSTVRKNSAAPSTSSSSSCFSPSIKIKMPDCGDSGNHQLSNHKTKMVRKKNSAAPSTSSSSSCFSPSVKRKIPEGGDSAALPNGSEQRPL
ncbi:hypothetical protein EYF80_010487 [Liparis tanakae]|uniref:Uncharacterized protein n=1 Tax=Liparis tanakae TaxID=230148 RepID=A0A4Z2IPV5_9TELE|nr:hypothetical protein EYF80_010487 [Liparis tanakae]